MPSGMGRTATSSGRGTPPVRRSPARASEISTATDPISPKRLDSMVAAFVPNYAATTSGPAQTLPAILYHKQPKSTLKCGLAPNGRTAGCDLKRSYVIKVGSSVSG